MYIYFFASQERVQKREPLNCILNVYVLCCVRFSSVLRFTTRVFSESSKERVFQLELEAIRIYNIQYRNAMCGVLSVCRNEKYFYGMEAGMGVSGNSK